MTNIYSDNATNTKGYRVHFFPPASPHFGGLWEEGVKSMKHHLRRVIGDIISHMKSSMLTAPIEACLNSHPLCPTSEDSQSLDMLTPGHFLTGAPLLPLKKKSARSSSSKHTEDLGPTRLHETRLLEEIVYRISLPFTSANKIGQVTAKY